MNAWAVMYRTYGVRRTEAIHTKLDGGQKAWRYCCSTVISPSTPHRSQSTSSSPDDPRLGGGLGASLAMGLT